jgi:hypothetical protein
MDPDGDQQSNYFEYLAKLNPTNEQSSFNLSIEPVPGITSQMRVQFVPRYPDRLYSVEVQAGALGGEFVPLSVSTVSDVGAVRTVVDYTATNAARFYRVRITLPEP